MEKIYIFSNFPEHCRDGMYQRIVEIDRILSIDFEIQYINFSLFKNWRSSTIIVNNQDAFLSRSVIKVNSLKYLFGEWKINERHSVIYVHSAFNFLSAFPVIFFSKKKIVFDMHGIVSEELKMERSSLKSYLFRFIEGIALYRSNIVICVSNAMKEYVETNYKMRKENQKLVVPTFEYSSTVEIPYKNINRNSKPKIIYAGGNQVWQNIDAMRNTANKFSEIFDFEFYLPVSAAKDFLIGVSSDSIRVGTLSKDELRGKYSEASMGFLLRSDNIVNRISSPTKMNEYFQNNVVPIVFDNCVGDMAYYGYEYITLDEIYRNATPDYKSLDRMSKNNFRKFKKQVSDAHENVRTLIEKLKILCGN